WTVTAGNEDGLAAKSETRVFFVEAPAILPDQTELLSPVDNYSDTLLTLTFEWKAAANADYYFLEILDEDLSVVFFDSLYYVIPAETYTKTVSDFEYDKSYTWTVTAGNESGLGTASESWTFNVEAPLGLPGKVVLIEPDSTKIYVLLELDFKWHAAENAEYYILEVFDEEAELIYRDSLIFEDPGPYSERLNIFEYKKSYSWSVTAGNSNGLGPNSELWTIKFHMPPVGSNLRLILPENNHVDSTLTVTFEWSSANYAEYYLLEILDEEATLVFFDSLLHKENVETYSRTLDLFEYDKAYSWTVRVGNYRGHVVHSERRVFTTKTPLSVDDLYENLKPTVVNDSRNNRLIIRLNDDRY
ncbi:MAG: hypothetical protein KAH48_08610, partial [Chlorobi bacterium]|nr:hypothetical protein [Chlorobiota bacterium]